MSAFTESTIEEAALARLEGIGWRIAYGPDIAPDTPAAENATICSAFQQLATYQAEVPSLFVPNAVLVVSDGIEARVGALGAGRESFKPWRTVAGDTLAGANVTGFQKA